MVFMRSTMTLELSWNRYRNIWIKGMWILDIYVFYGIFIVFKYLFIHCDRFREPMIDFYAPYKI